MKIKFKKTKVFIKINYFKLKKHNLLVKKRY